MQKLSSAQAILLEKLIIRRGALLVHEAQTTGRFQLTEGILSRTLHPATVESLIANGVLFKDLVGRVQLTSLGEAIDC